MNERLLKLELMHVTKMISNWKLKPPKRTKICDADERNESKLAHQIFLQIYQFLSWWTARVSVFSAMAFFKGKKSSRFLLIHLKTPKRKLRPFLFTFFSDKSRDSSLFLRLQSPLHYKSTMRRKHSKKSTSNPSRDMLNGSDPT